MRQFIEEIQMFRQFKSVIFVVSILLIAACNRNEGAIPKTTGNQQPAPAVSDNSGAPSQTERDNYLKSAREELDQLHRKIDELSDKAKNSSADLKSKWEPKRAELQGDLEVAEKKLQDLKGASASAWTNLKQSLNESIEKLRSAIQNASS
jgi:hypothetical protein